MLKFHSIYSLLCVLFLWVSVVIVLVSCFFGLVRKCCLRFSLPCFRFGPRFWVLFGVDGVRRCNRCGNSKIAEARICPLGFVKIGGWICTICLELKLSPWILNIEVKVSKLRISPTFTNSQCFCLILCTILWNLYQYFWRFHIKTCFEVQILREN